MSGFSAVVRPYSTGLPRLACTSCGNRARWTIQPVPPLREAWGSPPLPVTSSCGDCLEGQLGGLAAPPPQPVTVERLPGYGGVTCICGQAPIEWDVRSGTGEGRRIRRVCTADLASACAALAAPTVEAEIVDEDEPVHMRLSIDARRTACGQLTAPPTALATGCVWSLTWDHVTCPGCLQHRPS